MRSTVWLPAALLALACWSPSAPAAVLQVNIESPVHVPNGQDRVVYVHVFVRDIDNTDERLTTFTIAVNGVGFGSTGNLPRFLLPVQLPGDTYPYVFKDVESTGPESFNSTPVRLQIGDVTVPGGAEVDVTDENNGLFRIPIFIPDNLTPGTYPIIVDLASTQFAGNGDPIVAVLGTMGAITYVPEPSALALLALPALALLRRRPRTAPEHAPSR
jgi:hypothetical protein